VKKKKQPIAIIVVILLVLVAAGLVSHFNITNFHVVEPDVLYTSGQPRGMDYTRLLYKYHIGTIANVRSASEHRERNWYNEEITWVRSNGIRYYELPIERDIKSAGYFPNAETQKQFLNIMADKENLPVLIHGSSGRGRAAMLTAVWLAKVKKMDTEAILKVAKKIKTEPLVEAEKKYIASLAN